MMRLIFAPVFFWRWFRIGFHVYFVHPECNLSTCIEVRGVMS